MPEKWLVSLHNQPFKISGLDDRGAGCVGNFSATETRVPFSQGKRGEMIRRGQRAEGGRSTEQAPRSPSPHPPGRV